MQSTIQNGIIFGLILSLFMSLVILFSLWINPMMWAGRAPQDIRQAVGPPDQRASRQRRLFGLLTLLGVLVILVLSILQLNAVQAGLSFWPVFLNTFTVLTVWNVVDLLIIDWLLLVVIQPKFIIIPGTEGLKGYRDFNYHFRGFLKGLVLTWILSLLVAGAAMLVVWLVH